MKMPIGNLSQVVLEFADEVLMPAASARGGVLPFSVGVVSGLAAKRIPQIVSQYTPMLQALGVLDDQNCIDIDLLYEEASKALEKHPFIIAGYRVDKDDLDKLKTLMEKHGG